MKGSAKLAWILVKAAYITAPDDPLSLAAELTAMDQVRRVDVLAGTYALLVGVAGTADEVAEVEQFLAGRLGEGAYDTCEFIATRADKDWP